MSIGFWVVCGVVLFVIGNVMALKPPIHETRLTTIRLHARSLGLIPKLISIPAWLGTHLPSDRKLPKMIACYTLVNDAWQLPSGTFVIKDNTWQAVAETSNTHPFNDKAITTLQPYLLGLTSKANSISMFFYDEAYGKSFAIRDKTADDVIKQEIDTLYEYLNGLANI